VNVEVISAAETFLKLTSRKIMQNVLAIRDHTVLQLWKPGSVKKEKKQFAGKECEETFFRIL